MSSFVLKIIASACMLIDHIGATTRAPSFFRWIGRIAFPIYAYMIAQGCRHTKNINKYLLRLGIFALISEIPFDMAFMRQQIDFLNNTNVFYTLFFGVACIAVYERIKCMRRPWICLIALPIIPLTVAMAFMFYASLGGRRILTAGLILYVLSVLLLCRRSAAIDISAKPRMPQRVTAFVLALPMIGFGSLFTTDYSLWGVLYILFFYLMKPESRVLRTVAALIIVCYEYGYPVICELFYSNGIVLPSIGFMGGGDLLETFIVALIAVVFICLYNGKQGRKAKWAFYAFYPLHIAVLAVI